MKKNLAIGVLIVFGAVMALKGASRPVEAAPPDDPNVGRQPLPVPPPIAPSVAPAAIPPVVPPEVNKMKEELDKSRAELAQTTRRTADAERALYTFLDYYEHRLSNIKVVINECNYAADRKKAEDDLAGIANLIQLLRMGKFSIARAQLEEHSAFMLLWSQCNDLLKELKSVDEKLAEPVVLIGEAKKLRGVVELLKPRWAPAEVR